MRMSGAMLTECAEICFLPDWKESKGAKYEFGEAIAQNKPFFFFESNGIKSRGGDAKKLNKKEQEVECRQQKGNTNLSPVP